MIKSYWCTLGNQQSVSDIVAAINSEQTDFLNSLGITIDKTDINNIDVTAESDAFSVAVTGTAGITVTANSTNVVTTPTTTSVYCNLIFTGNSLLITKNSSSTVPAGNMTAWVCITKNADSTVSIICPDASNHIRIVERYDYESSSDVPYIDFSAYSDGVNQFSLAAIPRAASGKQFDNAFFTIARNATVYSGLGTINNTYFAFSKMTNYTFACK